MNEVFPSRYIYLSLSPHSGNALRSSSHETRLGNDYRWVDLRTFDDWH